MLEKKIIRTDSKTERRSKQQQQQQQQKKKKKTNSFISSHKVEEYDITHFFHSHTELHLSFVAYGGRLVGKMLFHTSLHPAAQLSRLSGNSFSRQVEISF